MILDGKCSSDDHSGIFIIIYQGKQFYKIKPNLQKLEGNNDGGILLTFVNNSGKEKI